jgi:hypothetical protein
MRKNKIESIRQVYRRNLSYNQENSFNTLKYKLVIILSTVIVVAVAAVVFYSCTKEDNNTSASRTSCCSSSPFCLFLYRFIMIMMKINIAILFIYLIL